MPAAELLIKAFQYLSLFGSALTVFKLIQSGLFRRYQAFFWYFIFRIPNSTWPLFFENNKTGYTYFMIWEATEPITWIFHTIIVLELFRLVLENHKGLYSVGRWVMMAGIGLSVTLSLASLIPRMPKSLSEQSRSMWIYLALERGVMLGLVILLLFLMAFLVLYTVPISRNVSNHARIYTLFFVSSYTAFLLQSFYGVHIYLSTNLAFNAVSAICVFAWFFLLNAMGEKVKSQEPILLSAEQERRILHQLDSLNATLLKVSRN